MSNSDRYEDLTDAQLKQLHEICDRFEQSLRQGQTPLIESELSQSPPDLRDALLHELLHLEIETRGQACRLEDFQDRFPSHHELLAEIFAELGESAGTYEDQDTVPVEGAIEITRRQYKLATGTDFNQDAQIGPYRLV